MTDTARPILFLDLDGVMCLSQPYGGYDAFLAIQRPEPPPPEDLWERLFVPAAMQALKLVHDAHRPHYVISSTWNRMFAADDFRTALRLGGLGFVADHLHEDWETPQLREGTHGERRAAEIDAWLAAHPGCERAWVVLDDGLSGSSLPGWRGADGERFVVLCDERVGLTEEAAQRLQQALGSRRSG